MPLAARLVPWSIAGLSLVVLGTLVVLNPYLDASPAVISGNVGATAPSWLIGLALIMLGSLAAVAAWLRQPNQPS